MFARIYILFFFLFALCASAASVLPRGGGQGSTCNANTGTQQCCQSVQPSNATGVAPLLGLLGIIVDAVVDVGLTCDPITVIGVSGTNCNSQAVCCTNNNFNGVVALGCTPININL